MALPVGLTVGRHKFAAAASVATPSFVPVRIDPEEGPAIAGEPGRLPPAHTRLPETASPPGKLRGAIEIEVRGRASGSRFALSPNWVPT
jgi:hypothetical protein